MKKSFIPLLVVFVTAFSSCTKSSRSRKRETTANESSQTSEATGTESTKATSQETPTSVPITVTTSQPTSSTTSVPTSQITSDVTSATTTSGEIPTPGSVVTKTIITSGDAYYTNSGFQKSEQVDDTSYPEKVTKLKNYLLSVVGSDQLLTNLSCTMLNHSKTDEKQLQLGSQSTAGKLEWTSAIPMKSVEVQVCNYYNKYTEWDTHIESYHPESTEVYVESTSMDIVAGDASLMPETKTISYTPEETFSKFTLGNTQKYLVEDTAYSRAYVYSITISWQY